VLLLYAVVSVSASSHSGSCRCHPWLSSATNGFWNDPVSWSPSHVPYPSDNVTIINSHMIRVSNNNWTRVHNLIIRTNSNIRIENGSDIVIKSRTCRDCTPPSITASSLFPSNGSVVSQTAALSFLYQFDETVQVVGTYIILRTLNNQPNSMWNLSIPSPSFTITPTDEAVKYQVEFPPGLVRDFEIPPNYNNRIKSWVFSVTPDITKPLIVSTIPADTAVIASVLTSMVIQFNKPMQLNLPVASKMQILLSGVVQRTVSAAEIVVNGTEVLIMFSPPLTMVERLKYDVQIACDLFMDTSKTPNFYDCVGLQWSFVIGDSTFPTVVTYMPGVNAVDVHSGSQQIFLQFSEAIERGSGAIEIWKKGESRPRTRIDSAGVTIADKKCTVPISNAVLNAKNALYYITISAGFVLDTSDFKNPYAGIADDTVWSFPTTGDYIDPDFNLRPDDPVIVSMTLLGNQGLLNPNRLSTIEFKKQLIDDLVMALSVPKGRFSIVFIEAGDNSVRVVLTIHPLKDLSLRDEVPSPLYLSQQLQSLVDDENSTLYHPDSGFSIILTKGSLEIIVAKGGEEELDMAFILFVGVVVGFGILLGMYLKKKSPKHAKFGSYVMLIFSIVDVWTDFLFVMFLSENANLELEYLLARIFLIGPMILNFVAVISILMHQCKEVRKVVKKDASGHIHRHADGKPVIIKVRPFLDWYGQGNANITTAVVLASVLNTGIFNLLSSHLLGSRHCSAPLSKEVQRRMTFLGLITNFFEDIPQIFIQIFASLKLGSFSNVVLASFTTTIFSLVFSVVKRVFGGVYMKFQATNAPDVVYTFDDSVEIPGAPFVDGKRRRRQRRRSSTYMKERRARRRNNSVHKALPCNAKGVAFHLPPPRCNPCVEGWCGQRAESKSQRTEMKNPTQRRTQPTQYTE